MRLWALTPALVALASPATGQESVRIESVGPGVAVIFGDGGNIGLSHGPDGNVLIDDQFAPLTERIKTAIRTVDRGPVRFVINTHWHSDHTGGNENFGKRGAVIVAHENVRSRMSTEQFVAAFNERVPPSPRAALPVVTFTRSVALHVNGDTLRVIHVAHAHTDGDSIVRWDRANVLHMGDAFFNRLSFPFIDLSSGGSIDGLIAAVDRGLQLTDERTRILPGHGPVATQAELRAHRDMLVDVRAAVQRGLRARRPLARILADRPARRYGMESGFVKPDDFVRTVHQSLRKAER